MGNHCLLLFIIFLNLSKVSLVQSGSIFEEREALMEFYKQTTLNSHWENTNNWLNAFSDHCSWYGVNCDFEGRVISLFLSENNLSGSIPSIIRYFEKLEVLNLSKNSLEGSIPQELSKLSLLKSLDLSENSFDSVEEESFLNLVDLEVLSLQNNNLDKIPNLNNCTKLEFLNLGGNQLINVSLSHFSQLERLRALIFEDNNNLDFHSKGVNMPSLTNLSLSNCGINDPDVLEGLVFLPKLDSLDLSYNKLIVFPTHLYSTTNLVTLDISHNLIGKIGSNLNNLTKLKILRCSQCGLTEFPKLVEPQIEDFDLAGNPELQILDLSSQSSIIILRFEAQRIEPLSFENMTTLKWFYLEGEVQQLPNLPNSVDYIMLWNTSFSKFPEQWESLENLTYFQMWYHRTTVEVPWFLRLNQTNKITHLALNGKVEGTIPKYISFILPNIIYLYIIDTQIKGTLPTEMGKLETLEHLLLQSNPLTGMVPSELSHLKNLVDIQITENEFSQDLDISLQVFNGLEQCFLSNKGEPFKCESETHLLPEKICSVNCDGDQVSGVWKNEVYDPTIPDIKSFETVYLNINPNGNYELLIRISRNGINAYSVIRTGSMKFSNLTQVGEDEYTFDVDFSVEKVILITHGKEVSNFFNWLCLSFVPEINEEVDITHQTCVIDQLGISINLLSIDECPTTYNRGFVNYKNSSLYFGEVNPINSKLCYPNKRPQTFSQYSLRKNWVCEYPHLLTGCIPLCGDGQVLRGETSLQQEECDDNNMNEGDGCSPKCKVEADWECSYTSDIYSTVCHKSEKKSILIPLIVSLIIVFAIFLIILVLYWRFNSPKGLYIPPLELESIKVLGTGSFGRVYEGLWRGTTRVAIKEMKTESLTNENLRLFEKEAKFLMDLPPHPNIVQFFGLSRTGKERESLTKELKIVIEFLPGGNLSDFLQDRTAETIDLESRVEITRDYVMILQLAQGIAAGMDHLHKNEVLHRDLAARNILIQKSVSNLREGEKLVVVPKISDFGLSSKNSKNSSPIPIRWTAPEVFLNRKNFCKGSDVWSFGILLFELSVHCREVPYKNLKKNSQVRSFVLSGGQVTKSNNVPSSYHSFMFACFTMSPSLRPTFSQLFEVIKQEEIKQQVSSEVNSLHLSHMSNNTTIDLQYVDDNDNDNNYYEE